MSNAIETIDNEMICFIIYCLNCIRLGRNATYERGLRFFSFVSRYHKETTVLFAFSGELCNGNLKTFQSQSQTNSQFSYRKSYVSFEGSSENKAIDQVDDFLFPCHLPTDSVSKLGGVLRFDSICEILEIPHR